MRISVVALILAGLAASPVSSATGKQPESWQLQTREWRNLLADTKALDEFTALRLKYLEAFDRHDAPAMTAFYADDGVAVTPDGWFSGHDAIQQWYEFLFHRWQPSDVMWQLDRLTGTDNQAWGSADGGVPSRARTARFQPVVSGQLSISARTTSGRSDRQPITLRAGFPYAPHPTRPPDSDRSVIGYS